MSFFCKLGLHSWRYLNETFHFCHRCPKQQDWGWDVKRNRACWR